MLVKKNKDYGNSFAEPLNIFAKELTPKQMIAVRMNDKLARLKSGSANYQEDTVLDIFGYLALWKILDNRELGEVLVNAKPNQL